MNNSKRELFHFPTSFIYLILWYFLSLLICGYFVNLTVRITPGFIEGTNASFFDFISRIFNKILNVSISGEIGIVIFFIALALLFLVLRALFLVLLKLGSKQDQHMIDQAFAAGLLQGFTRYFLILPLIFSSVIALYFLPGFADVIAIISLGLLILVPILCYRCLDINKIRLASQNNSNPGSKYQIGKWVLMIPLFFLIAGTPISIVYSILSPLTLLILKTEPQQFFIIPISLIAVTVGVLINYLLVYYLASVILFRSSGLSMIQILRRHTEFKQFGLFLHVVAKFYRYAIWATPVILLFLAVSNHVEQLQHLFVSNNSGGKFPYQRIINLIYFIKNEYTKFLVFFILPITLSIGHVLVAIHDSSSLSTPQ